MPQNKQEHLVSLITQYSVGSAFVFEPDEFRKGHATREPADLVWHCNECTVLIYMRYFQSSKGIQKNKNKSIKCIKHNLDQARGWLREWRAGRSLIGRNKHQKFSIKHGDQEHIAVLSIIDGSNCVAKYHDEFTQECDVTCCGTIPQKVLEFLIKHGASSIDLIHFLTRMSHATDYIEESKCIDYVKNDYINITKSVDPKKKWINKADDHSYEYITKMMKSLIYNNDVKNKENGISEIAGRISDLPLMDYWVLITSMLEQKEHSKINTKVWWSRIRLPASGTHVVLASGTTKGTSENISEILKLSDPIEGITPSFTIIWMFLGGELENTMLLVNKIIDVSYTKRFLDEFSNKT